MADTKYYCFPITPLIFILHSFSSVPDSVIIQSFNYFVATTCREKEKIMSTKLKTTRERRGNWSWVSFDMSDILNASLKKWSVNNEDCRSAFGKNSVRRSIVIGYMIGSARR